MEPVKTPYNLPHGFRPMKGDTAQIKDIRYPCLASPKIDGFRCIVGPGGVALSASLKPIPNQFVQDYFKRHSNILTGLDGELVVGPPDASDVFEKTSGALRRKEGEPDFTFWIFDDYGREVGFEQAQGRYEKDYMSDLLGSRCKLVKHYHMRNAQELQALVYEHSILGYEGTMIRSPDGPYKFGRSTKKEGYLLKIKPFRDDEAVILGLIEQQKNLNEKVIDERGLSKRSSHKANKAGAGTLGGFHVRVLTGPFAGVETTVTCGVLTKEQKQEIWRGQFALYRSPNSPKRGPVVVGKVMTFKHMMNSGGYTKPRHAGFLRFRPDFDLPEN